MTPADAEPFLHEVSAERRRAARAGLAAVVGPLAARARGKRVGIVLSGSNIDAAAYADLVR